ncbi:unnamed protein product [Closterium sp. NIES-54]
MAALQALLSTISNPSLALQHNFVSHAVNNQPSAVKISPRRLTRAAASSASRDDDVDSQLDRRSVLLSMAAVALSPMVPVSEASAITVPKQVGAFLPKSEDGDFVVFTPGMKDTPALRAGNVSPYTFNIPPTWTQSRIANILSGNYCQPKCAEPWIEVKFEDPREGLLQVVASPMVRLTNKLELPIEEIGTPERIIAALGPFVTGDSYDPDEVVDTRIRKEGDQTYYEYYMETPYARSGAYNLASATAKGSTVLLLQFLLVPFRVDLPAITGNLRFLRCQHSIGQFRCSMKCWLVIMWQPCGAGGLRGFLHRWLCWQALMLPFPPIQSLFTRNGGLSGIEPIANAAEPPLVLPNTSIPFNAIRSACCEMVVGHVAIPIGVAGPSTTRSFPC